MIAVLAAFSSSQTQYTCQYGNPPSCGGSCPPGQFCMYKMHLSHLGGYCTCVDAPTTTVHSCSSIDPQQASCSLGYCANNLLCLEQYGKCVCRMPTTTTKKTTTTTKPAGITTTTLKPTVSTTTTLKPYIVTSTIKTTTSTTFLSVADILQTYTSTTIVQSPTVIAYAKTPEVPKKDMDPVAFSMDIEDMDGIRLIRLKLNGKTVKTCYPRGAKTSACLHEGGPFGGRQALMIEVIDDLGNLAFLDGTLDVSETGGTGPGCAPDCQCMSADMATIVFGGNFEQCSMVSCGSQESGGTGTVVDVGSGSAPIPLYCYRPGPTCPGGCSCLTPMQAQATVGGLGYRPCECSVTGCGTGRACYELGCRPVNGQLFNLREEHAPYSLVHAIHTTSGAERIMPAAGMDNESVDPPRLMYSGCLSTGVWELTPIYEQPRTCDSCPIMGEWIPPSMSVDATDLCGPPLERDFTYSLMDTIPPTVNITTVPETLAYYNEANITVFAADMSGIHRIVIYESGIAADCEDVEEIEVARCCASGTGSATCVYSNQTYKNFTTVEYKAVACDMAGNVGQASISKKVIVNETDLKIGSLCSCREGPGWGMRFQRYDQIAAGDLIVGGYDEIAHASASDSRVYIRHANGSMHANISSIFTDQDRLAVADITGDGEAELLIANSEDGRVYAMDSLGAALGDFSLSFEAGDGFAAADVLGDGRAEMMIASHDDETIYLHGPDGAYLDSQVLSGMDGIRYAADTGWHDGLAAADVFGDEKAEVIVALNSDDRVWVFDAMLEPRAFVDLERFTAHDSFGAADMVGDEKAEFIVAIDDDGAVYVYDLSGLLKVNYFPYTKFDGLTAGQLLPSENEEFAVAIDEDRTLYIEHGEDALVGVGT